MLEFLPKNSLPNRNACLPKEELDDPRIRSGRTCTPAGHRRPEGGIVKKSIVILVLALAGAIVVPVQAAADGCPADGAGKIVTASGASGQEFEWDLSSAVAGEYSLKDKLVIDLAYIPPSGKSTIEVTTPSGKAFIRAEFLGDGGTREYRDKVDGGWSAVGPGTTFPPSGYSSDSWNDIGLTVDFSEQSSSFRDNGTEGTGWFSDSGNKWFLVGGLRIYSSDSGATEPLTAYIDSVQISKVTGKESVVLFSETFDSAPSIAPSVGELLSIEKPMFGLARHAACIPSQVIFHRKKTPDALLVKGRIEPVIRGSGVGVWLFKKVDGKWVVVERKFTHVDWYNKLSTSLPRVTDAERCRVRVDFYGGGNLMDSHTAKFFNCADVPKPGS